MEQRQPPNLEWVKIATDVKEAELHNIRINRTKDYYWRVKAANEFGFSEPSMPIMLKKKEGASSLLNEHNSSQNGCIPLGFVLNLEERTDPLHHLASYKRERTLTKRYSNSQILSLYQMRLFA